MPPPEPPCPQTTGSSEQPRSAGLSPNPSERGPPAAPASPPGSPLTAGPAPLRRTRRGRATARLSVREGGSSYLLPEVTRQVTGGRRLGGGPVAAGRGGQGGGTAEGQEEKEEPQHGLRGPEAPRRPAAL